MKAAVVHAPNSSVAIEDRARPSPDLGQVLIRVHAAASVTVTSTSSAATFRLRGIRSFPATRSPVPSKR
jgi:hypothetical protein